MRKHKKPTGEIGITRLEITRGDATRTVKSYFDMVEFPDTKGEIEKYIVRTFLRNSAASSFPFSDCKPIPLEESDLDFKLTCPDGRPRKIELMEVSVLEHLRCTYETAPAEHKAYEYAEFIYKKVMGKSRKYGTTPEVDQYLLLYVTDRRFKIAGPVLTLLRYWTASTPHNFEEIYLFTPIEKDRGDTLRVFPSAEREWDDFDPESLRDRIVYHLTAG